MNAPRDPLRPSRRDHFAGTLRLGAGIASAGIGALAVASGPSRAAAAHPGEVAIDYAGYLGQDGDTTRIGRARLVFAAEQERYRLALEVTSLFVHMRYESVGALHAAGLRPRAYRETRRLPGRSPKVRAVRLDDGSRDSEPSLEEDVTRLLSVPVGTQDRVSLLWQASLLMRQRQLSPGRPWRVHFATFEAVEQAVFDVGRTEPLRLGRRTVNALHLARTGLAADATAIDLWLADDAAATPVVFRFADEGRTLRFVAT